MPIPLFIVVAWHMFAWGKMGYSIGLVFDRYAALTPAKQRRARALLSSPWNLTDSEIQWLRTNLLK